MDFVDEFGHFTSQKSLEIRWFRHMIHYIDTVYNTFTVHRYVVNVYIIYNTILWPHHLTQLKFTHTSKSVWNIIFQAVLQPLPRRKCNCVDGHFSKCRTHTHTLNEKLSLQISCVNAQSWISPFGFSSLSAMERREDSQPRMLGSLPWIDSQFVGLCAEL